MRSAPLVSFALLIALLSAIGCAGLDEPPKSPKKNVGQPVPTAVTSAEPLWLTNDPNRKQSSTDAQIARLSRQPWCGYPTRVAGTKVSFTVRGEAQRSRLSALPALSLVPEPRAPPKGC